MMAMVDLVRRRRQFCHQKQAGERQLERGGEHNGGMINFFQTLSHGAFFSVVELAAALQSAARGLGRQCPPVSGSSMQATCQLMALVGHSPYSRWAAMSR